MRSGAARLILALSAIVLLAGCGSDTNNSGNTTTSYKDTKSMVLDILKSEDGRKAVQEATFSNAGSAGGLQILSANDPQQLQLAVKDVLTDTSNNQFLNHLLTDPKFAGEFAKAIEKDTKQIFKDLIKDPEYQKTLLGAMKSPDFELMLLDTMKTTPYRAQMKTVIQESMQSPLFRLELMNLMKKALQEEALPKENKGTGSQGQEGEQNSEEEGQEDSSNEKNGEEKEEESQEG